MKNITEEFNQALDYIYSFVDFSKTRNLRYSPENFDLSRMVKLVNLLGNPQYQYPVIHVAGTKGKGSTCAIIASILKNAGYKVGFYSSPHMIDFRERIKINDVCISKADWISCVKSNKNIIEKVERVSTFEIITALAFKYFADKKIDFGVIEVGMGGRLDATNVVNPELAVITHISLDHTKILGDTIEQIAKEKAGIIKAGRPVVVANQEMKAMVEISKIASEKNAKLIESTACFSHQVKNSNLKGQELLIRNKHSGKENVYYLPLIGDHQADNLLTAMSAIQTISQSEFSISTEAIELGIKQINWPGRFEVISKNPLIIIDCAHNPDSINKLRATIKEYLKSRKVNMIFGVSEDKDYLHMMNIMKPIVNEWIFTQSDHPRALDTKELAKTATDINLDNFKLMDIESIMPEIYKDQNEDTVFIATGSIFVAAALKQAVQGEDSTC